MSKRQNEDNMFIPPLVHIIEVLHLDCLAIQLRYFDLNCYLGFEFGSTIALGRALLVHQVLVRSLCSEHLGSILLNTSPFESTTQASQPAFGGSIIGSSTPIGAMCYCNGIWDKGGGSKFNKMQLKMAVARIKLLQNKRRAVVKQMRPDIALLLQSGQDEIHDWPTGRMDANLQMIAKVAAVCNNDSITQAEQKYVAHGMPTEAAPKFLVEKMALPEESKGAESSNEGDLLGCCQKWNEFERRSATREFDRDKKSMGVIVNSVSGKKSLLVKGAV